jgi:DNA-directed RNA polymerase specialized sigma24 family protein
MVHGVARTPSRSSSESITAQEARAAMREEASAAAEFHRKSDAIYQALPPLGTDEYLRHITEAPTDALPPQVLVRAYRELAKAGPSMAEAANRTFKRLTRKKGERFEYLGPMVVFLYNRVPRNQYAVDLDDLVQDAVIIMLRALPTDRGRFGEESWHTFARQCAYTAWQAHVGRKGERQEPPRDEPSRDSETGRWSDPLERARESDSADNVLDVDTHTFLAEVIAAIPDPFLRAVAEDQWLSGDPSPDSGKGTSEGGKRSLMKQFGKTRDSIIRARRIVEARILAALEARGISDELLAQYRKKER